MADNVSPSNDPDSRTSGLGAPGPPEAARSFANVDAARAPAGGDAAEDALWSGRTDWKHFAGMILAYAAASTVLLVGSLIWLELRWAGWLLLAVVVVGIVIAARLAVIVLSTRYHLTSERLFIERGLVSLIKDQTELIRVDDVRVRKRLVDRIFNLGTVEVMSTDMSDQSVVIEGVADADEVAELIRAHMRTARKKSLFIENL